jgi:hypothetical protein
MKILQKLFAKGKPPKSDENIMKIANCIGPLLDGAVHDIFTEYRTKLLPEPITYIVPAVWGAKKDGELTPVQKEIHARIMPVINKVFDSLLIKDLNSDQEFAIYFLIRSIIIAKITFMIEAFRNRLNERTIEVQHLKDTLIHFKPAGNA